MLMTKSIIFSKKNIRYFIIFIILLIVLFLLSITRIGITNKVYDIENEEIYRTIYVRFNSNIDINNIKDVTYIENMYLGNNNEYTIIFKEYNDIYRFIDNYSDTYKDISSLEESGRFIEDCKSIFGEYITDDAFDLLMANRIFTRYSSVISEASAVTDINFTKTSETENDGYIHFEYEVSYKLELNGETVDMKDYMAFNVLDEKGYKIEKVSISLTLITLPLFLLKNPNILSSIKFKNI